MSDENTLDLIRLGQSIRSLRTGKGWSLSDLTEKSTVPKAYLSDLENGTAGKPNIQYVYSVATALGVTIDQILDGAKPRSHRREKVKKEDLPPGLLELQSEMNLTEEDLERLAQISFRGHRPRDKEGWRFLVDALRLISQKPNQK